MFDQLTIYAGKDVFAHEEAQDNKRHTHRVGPVAQQILSFLRDNPGSTAHQINVHIGGPALRAQQRLRDLEKRRLATSKFMEAKPGAVANGSTTAKHYWRVE